MVDRDRVLACLAELDGYLGELRPFREFLRTRLGDFEAFEREVRGFLARSH